MTSILGNSFVVLIILDGWGIAKDGPGNAISLAKTPNIDRFWKTFPHTRLDASGQAVGLPEGESGNTETGHLNLGAGRVVYQDLERINKKIEDGRFNSNQTLLGAIEHIKKNHSKLHIMGLVGAGGVHSSFNHLIALIKLFRSHISEKLYLHVFTDGRDSSPTSSLSYIERIERMFKEQSVGKIASVMGRYWSMDRDQRWSRTEKAYFALTKGKGEKFNSAKEAVETSYHDGKTDEFIEPSVILNKEGKPTGLIENDDAAIFFNFRIDRPRQLTGAFVIKDFTKANINFGFNPHKEEPDVVLQKKIEKLKKEPFQRGKKLDNLFFGTMTEYSRFFTKEGVKPAFPPEIIDMPLGRVISAAGLRQLRLTESEKERFVTYYFNGLRDKPFYLEERIILPSPAVATYDQKPEMRADDITKTLLEKIKTRMYQFILVNYPNSDMLGHTGNINQAIKAIETVDGCIKKIAKYILAGKGTLIITADHGNAEEMLDLETGGVNTEHSSNPVPFIAISRKFLTDSRMLPCGKLADVATTVLALLGISCPSTMFGRNLLAGVLK
jgi:2,3-bisphosphoglycerate-independent phosphoglycerate mutase